MKPRNDAWQSILCCAGLPINMATDCVAFHAYDHQILGTGVEGRALCAVVS
jgi:hypothetical protein